MAMMRRGVLVDEGARSGAIITLQRDLKKLERACTRHPLIAEVWDQTALVTGLCRETDGKHHKWPRGVPDAERSCERCGGARLIPAPFNPGSRDQVWHLFYDLYNLPVQKNKKREESVDEEIMDRVGRKWPKYHPVTVLILEARAVKKQLGFMKSRLSADGRMRQSVNVGGPNTGRWSSSKNPYKEGTNLQNIAEKNRHIFIADAGKEFLYPDLKQAESLVVAYDARDEGYIEAHLSGDVHTFICRILWPDLPWTGDLKRDKVVAKQPAHFDPDHTYRFAAKRCQHGLNYGLRPQGLAMWAHITLGEARVVYDTYYDTFPGIRAWHLQRAKEVKETGVLVTPLGRRRQFFGRLKDPHTIRQAIAYIPQSVVADVLNVVLWRIWHDMDPEQVWLLAQVHDAILCETERGDEDTMMEIWRKMEVPVPMGDRTMVIPVEMTRGRNWGNWDEEKNPRGIKEVEEGPC
jgi:DNA polymerase-1